MNTSTYTINVQSEFSAAHSLRGYQGECARLHGHNWKVKVELNVYKLNDIGIALDFKNLKALLVEILSPFEHQNLNEIPPFDVINPTAENISAYVYKQLAKVVTDQDCKLKAVTIWETDRSSVRYSEDD